jgi:hypothetical protein
MVRLASLEIIPRLPDCFSHERGNELPPGLVGSRVLRFGTVKTEISEATKPMLEGGGLVIDYVPQGSTTPVRVVLSLNEAGMWVVYQGAILD